VEDIEIDTKERFLFRSWIYQNLARLPQYERGISVKQYRSLNVLWDTRSESLGDFCWGIRSLYLSKQCSKTVTKPVKLIFPISFSIMFLIAMYCLCSQLSESDMPA
jgi:hypothetical protein